MRHESRMRLRWSALVGGSWQGRIKQVKLSGTSCNEVGAPFNPTGVHPRGCNTYHTATSSPTCRVYSCAPTSEPSLTFKAAHEAALIA